MNFFLRSLGLPDTNEILNFARKSFVDTYAHLNTPDNMAIYVAENFTKAQIEAQLSDTLNTFTGVFIADKLVAYSKTRPNNYTENETNAKHLELERIYVDKVFHGHKLGAKLVQNALEQAKANHYNELWLGVWQENLNAIAFYKKMGFEIFDTHIFQLGTDAQSDYLMRIKI